MTVADLDAYLDLIESERFRRPSESLLADEIKRLRRETAHTMHCMKFGCERCLALGDEAKGWK